MATATQVPPAAGLDVRHSHVGGREVVGRGGRRSATNPATGRAFAEMTLLDAVQAAEAVVAARAAFPAWNALSPRERGRHLLALRQVVLAESEDVANLITEEQGKPAAEAYLVEIFPVLEALKHLALHAGDVLREEAVESQVLLFAHKDCRIEYVPYGVVLVITPWNYPFSISLSGVANALAAGNTVVLKPAPATTLIGLRIAALCQTAGLPEGVINVVASDDTVAAGLVEHPDIDKIVFTGSVATGKKVMASAAKNVTPVVLELGGKDCAVVCSDADIDRAAKGIVWGAFVNAGQTCASVERVYVEDAVAEAFVSKVVEETRRLRVGDPSSTGVDMGPMTSDGQRQVVEQHVADAVVRGARVLTGGVRVPGPGYFYPPTVLVNVDHSMRIMREETFGPVLPIMSVPTLEEAIRLANDSEYGLTASGWTQSAETARVLQDRLQAGVVTINDCVASYGEPTAPWGGMKTSGIGRTHGLAGLRELTQVKYVTRDPSRKAALWWYPYGEDFRGVMRAAVHALHGASLLDRAGALFHLLTSRRFWSRVRLLDLLKGVDRLS